ncbi:MULTISPECIES: hypothetical protein [Methylobacterium]|uniref:Uncharacterized protein n=1 Tax=Methylobacterium ajmalii TaxID=2738439 RepID=A0ABV0A502_9HYPH|nr:hypothetical protein [Methylobacterium aquaticum]
MGGKFVSFDEIIDRPTALLHDLAESIGPIQLENADWTVDAVSHFIDPKHNRSRNLNRSVDENVKPAIDL